MNITQDKSWYKVKDLIPRPLYEPLLSMYYNLRRIGYLGNDFYCPVCNHNIRKFQLQSCPVCGSRIRHRALWLFLLRKTNFFKDNLNVLHFAPEHCFYKRMKKLPNLRYLSADLGSPRAMIKVDMTNIQYADESFDVLISSHVLEHIDDDLQAMKELYRVQKSDGWSIHLAPVHYSRKETFEDPSITSPEDRRKYYGHFDHKRIYGIDYKERLESVGFKVTFFQAKDFCTEKEIVRMGLKEDTDIYYCTK